ncbi:alpha/beta fold hydrolase [Oribacterium sp. WCC10]|uniref:alpha/beta fold hydrolase n=1 Tax=Oribacterium sp. WCC10 TaxID=1855343 RepID=UPI0015872FF0|nr:alpha/beta fold hydrolase [Oribacterium sp. WCC10]
MERREWYTPSANGDGKIYNCLYRNEKITQKAVMIIVHGMQSHSGRYLSWAYELSNLGYTVAMLDLQGHGKSQNHSGSFGEKNGWMYMLHDIRRLILKVKKWFPELPVVLFGHSMGSFLVRSYITRFPADIDALILSGTARFNYSLYSAYGIVKADVKLHGGMYPATRYEQIMCNLFNRDIIDPVNDAAWCCTVREVCEQHSADPLATKFTIGAYYEMIKGLISVREDKWAVNVPIIPIYIFCGGADPVGEYGKGPAEVYAWLHATGHDVEFRIYPKKRHEMIWESNQEEVRANIYNWLNKKLPQIKRLKDSLH